MNKLFFLTCLSVCLIACNQNPESGHVRTEKGIYYVSSSPLNAVEGTLSDFFTDIEYIWLKDDQDGSEIGEISTILAAPDFMIVVDDWVCNCLQLFDYEGNFVRKIKSYGEGPGRYMDISEVRLKDDKIYLMDGATRKILIFDFEGTLLEELKLPFRAESFSFDPKTEDFYFYIGRRDPELTHEVVITDASFHIKKKFLPIREDLYYGKTRDRSNFWNVGDQTVFLRSELDTLYMIGDDNLRPYIVFSYGEYGIDHSEYQRMQKELSSKEFLDHKNKNRRFQLTALGNLNQRWLMLMNGYQEQSYSSMLDLKENKLYLIQSPIPNDLDEGIDPYRPHLMLDNDRMAISKPGKTLYKAVQEKKSGMSQEEWETYVKGKGRKLVRAAFNAQKSENPVLMVFNPKP